MNITRIALALATVAACKGGSSSKTADLAVFAKPEPPGDLAKVKHGMKQEDVKALFKDAHPPANHSGSPVLATESGYKNVEYTIHFYGDTLEVASVQAELLDKLDVAGQAKKMWGPLDEHAQFGPAWVSPDGAWEIHIVEMGRNTSVEYKPFTPLDKAFLGDKPGLFAQLAKLHWGMTRAEIGAVEPKLVPAPHGSATSRAFEPGARKVEFWPRMDDADERLAAISVELPKNGEDALTKAWGAPQAGARGAAPCKVWDSPDKATRIVLEDGSSSDVEAWLSPPATSPCKLPSDAPATP